MAGVVDHGIDAAIGFDRLGDQSFEIIRLASGSFNADAAEFGGKLHRAARRRHQAETIAARMQFAGDGSAHAATSAGNDCDGM